VRLQAAAGVIRNLERKRRNVTGRLSCRGTRDDEVGFQLGAYDRAER